MTNRITASLAVVFLLLGAFNTSLQAFYNSPTWHPPLLATSIHTEDPVLFTVNGKEVRVSEFVYIYNKTNGDKAEYSEKSLREYLQLYVDFKLQVAKGIDMGLNENPDVKREQDQYKRQLSSTYLIDREITERLVKEAYEWSKEDRRISHILVALSENATEEDIRQAYQRIQQAKSQLTPGNFAEIVKSFSDDAYSKSNGGDLGFFTTLQLPYELEKAMYSTAKGAYSDIVRSKYGFHILKVEDIRPAYGQVQLAHILVRTKMGEEASKKLIDSLHAELKKGGNFEDLAAKFSQDNSTNTRGGIMGWVGINKYPADFEAAIFGLQKDGAYSAPILSSAGWHILKRVKAMKTPSYQEVKGELTNKIKQNPRFEIVQDSLVERIKREAAYKEDAAVLADIIKALNADPVFLQGRWNPSDEQLKDERVLFSLGDSKSTVKDFYLLAQRSPNERFALQPRTTEAAVERILRKLAAQKCLEYEETQLEKKYPEFKALMREYEEGILLFEVKKQLVWDKASSDEEGLKKFFEAHKEKFQWKERAVVTFYTVRSVDAKIIKSIKKKAKKSNPDAVKDAFNKDNALVQTTGATYEKGKNAEVDALKWKVGTVSEGYAKDGSTYFIKMEEVNPPATKSLEEARGYVVADYQDELEKNLIKELRAAYKVEIKEDVLKSLIKK